MMQEFLSILATIAGVGMSVANFPQSYRIWKRRSGKDVSLLTYSIMMTGTVIWTIYGFMVHDWPIIISYLVGIVGTGSVLVLAIKYR